MDMMNMDPGVLDDRVKIGPEFVPRRLTAGTVKAVMAGETWIPDPDSTWDYVEVQRGGVLKFARDRATTLRSTNILNLPGGLVDMGTPSDPIQAGVKVRVIIRDVPIDTTVDPFQWGNSFLNFGKQTRYSARIRTQCADLDAGLAEGQQDITLPEAPEGWQVGDEVIIPDTRYPTRDNPSRREAKTTIASISGTALHLSKPLDFARDPITRLDGTVVKYACVCNVTRDLSVESENPNGTPGHHANVGSDTTWEMNQYQHLFLGRTRAEVLNSTTVNADGSFTIGTNQIARYGDHDHHTGAGGAVSYRDGGVILGQAPFKWAMVCHGTHYATYRRMTVVGYAGAGFTTEDGYETGWEMSECMAMYITSPAEEGNPLDASVNIARNAPGIEGAGFWLHSTHDGIFNKNEAWCCRKGVLIIQQQQKPGLYPSQRGLVPDTPFTEVTQRTAVFASCEDNVVIGNFSVGWEIWGATFFPNKNLVAAKNRDIQFLHAASSGTQPWLINPAIIGDQGRSVGIHASMAYITDSKFEGGYVEDCEVGMFGGGGNSSSVTDGVTLQNVLNIDLTFSGISWHHKNVRHVPLPGHDPYYIQLGTGRVWDGIGPLISDSVGHLPPCRGSQYFVENWQGTGKDFLLFHNQQRGSLPAMHSSDTPGVGDKEGIPEKGLSMLAAWQKYGLAYRGEACADADIVPMEGLRGGFARASLTSPLTSPPFAVMFYPAPYHAVKPDQFGRGVEVRCALVGNFREADEILYYKVNGGAPATYAGGPGQFLDERRFFIEVGPGDHQVEMWRQVDGASGPIAGSSRTAIVHVAQPDVIVAVPNLINLSAADATAAIEAAGLTLGVVTPATNAAPAGTVIDQSPSAGRQVPKGTPVAIAVSTGQGTQMAIVPNVVGQTVSAATTALQNAGLALGSHVGAHSTTVPMMAIISQHPSAGDSVPVGTAVDVVESLGPVVIDMVTVPNVVGQAQTQASMLIMDAGLTIGPLTTKHDPALAGLVLAQSPTAGTSVAKGSSVSMTVSSGPAIDPPPDQETWTATTIPAEKSSKGRTRVTFG